MIANTGSCPLVVPEITSSNPTEFVLPNLPSPPNPPYVLLPDQTAAQFPVTIAPGSYVILPVTFVAPTGGAGTKQSTITITHTVIETFTFVVRAEMFNFNIPGPGGVTTDFRLWLNTTRGVTRDGSSKVSKWADVGTNPKDAIQTVTANQPTYIDNATSNINFNPVIEFKNDGTTSINQFLYNDTNGFYSQEIFVVMESDVDVTSSSGMTIFSGSIADILTPENYVEDIDDVTGVGLGDFTSNLTGERLWYNQGSSTTNPYYFLPASSSRTYNTAGIINAGNKSTTISDGMRILYNSIDDFESSTKTVANFENVGWIEDLIPDPDYVWGTPYNIGKNKNTTLGNLNGRVAEIFTFSSRLSDMDRQKIESYLAIKYGITLGASTQAQKDYINSFGPIDGIVWDVSENTDYNHHVAGIGRDDNSDLNQKQSKTINSVNGVTIGLGGIFNTNSANPNEFDDDGDFLVWGNDSDAFNGTNTNTITIGSSITTTLTRIDRKWKMVESTQAVGGDVGTVFVGIPTNAFSGFSKTADEEYVLIVADSDAFTDSDIIDVIPLKINRDATGTPILDSNGNQVYKTWYDFHGIKYFTFGKALKKSENHSISIGPGDYLVGEYALNLNVNDFTISAWIKNNTASANPRTIMSKGNKLQLRLNTSDQIEVMVDNDVTPKFTSSMQINDGKWHQITFVYISGTIYLYVDGILDKSEQNVTAPSPNFNYFTIGALYVDKNTITNPFLGEIDEVYVWDQGLNENQVHYLMNQEVEKVPIVNLVSGKIIPTASASNEVATIAWSKLKAYYDFNSFYGSTVEGLTDDRNFLRLKYLAKDKTLIDAQTTPTPYISASDGAWDTPSTWSNNADQVPPNSVGLDGTTKRDWNIVHISHNITSGDRDISLLGLIQTGGILTIADPTDAQDQTNSGQELTITHYLELDGVIDLVGESQLIQTEGSIIDADSGGYIEKDQQGTANGFNYNYWSSSVGPIGGNIATTGSGISSTNASNRIEDFLYDGSISSTPNPMTFESVGYNFTPPLLGPPGILKIFTYWLYKFNGPADDYNAWVKIDETTDLLAGEGFTMKGTAGSVPVSDKQNYVFKGLPNNGDIILALDKSSGNVERLIGNPYPSAIDAYEFILDNISTTEGGYNTNTVINGALYFWDHFGEENSHTLKDYVGGYATYNLTGGAPAISNDVRINNTGAAGTKVPGQFIPVNQGFFVSTKLETNPNDNLGTISSVDGGTIIFKNSQRVYATELDESSPGIPSSVFMKSSKDKSSSKIANNRPKNVTPTIRLVYDSPIGYHRQLVIGANNKASNGFDLGYDAFMVDVNKEDMYWNFSNSKFVIQGVADFNASQEFSLGLIVKNSGVAKIKLDAFENMESNIPVFIKDELTGETKNINSEPFEVNLEPGVYNDRFKLVFKAVEESSIEVESEVAESAVTISYNTTSSELSILNNDEIKIKDLVLYDILGNEIKTKKLNSRSNASIHVSAITGLYIVKLNTEKGIVTKKIIIE